MASEQLEFMQQPSSWACANFTALVLPILLCLYVRLLGVWFSSMGRAGEGGKFSNCFAARHNMQDSSRYKKGKHAPAVTWLKIKGNLEMSKQIPNLPKKKGREKRHISEN